jgi:hypothetical protein
MKVLENAQGLTGVLIISGTDVYFRVGDKREFVDYKVEHNDLVIKILDMDAYLYQNGKETILDYSPETIGWENVE